MLPVIALVGRPNVGKSTLFNVLTRSRDALVADLPGLTRDRQYGFGKVGPFPYVVVDTGGLSGDASGIDAAMARQTLRALEEADHVILLVDGREALAVHPNLPPEAATRLAHPSHRCLSRLLARSDLPLDQRRAWAARPWPTPWNTTVCS